MAHPVAHINNSQAFQKLLERAELQGYISADDILEMFPGIARNKELFDQLKDAIRLQGIEVFDGDPLRSEEAELHSLDEEPVSILDDISSDDTVSLYLKEMSLTPLLTVEEEINLAKRIASGRQAKREIGRLNGQSLERRQELEISIQEGRLAREALIKANTRLVVSIARRYIGRGVHSWI